MTTLLQQAIDLAQSGQRQTAEDLLRQVVAEQPDNEVAWIWLSAVSRGAELKQQAIERVLSINPDNPLAQKGLARVGRGAVESPAAKPPIIDAPPPVAPAPSPPQPVETPAPAFDFDFDAVADRAEADVLPVSAPQDEAPDFSFDFDTDETDQLAAQPESLFPGDFDLEGPSPADFDFDFDITPAKLAPEVKAPVEPEGPSPADFDFDFDITPAKPTPEVKAPVEPEETLLAFSFGFETEASPTSEQPESPDEPDETLFDTPPAFFAEIEADAAPGDDSSAWDEPVMGSDALAERLGFAEASVEEVEEEEIEAAILEDEPEEKPEKKPEISPEESLLMARQRQQKQTRMLIIGTAVFAFMVVFCLGMYYYLAEVSDIYTIAPQLAGPELQVEAPKPNKEGVSILNFQGYSASRAKIDWAEGTDCTSTTGLEVDFMNGDPPSLLSNRLCSGGVCTYPKDITPASIGKVTVTYICGKDAVITLYSNEGMEQ